VQPPEARPYFHPNYLGFLETQLKNFSVQNEKIVVAHWTFCSDGQVTGIHLTLFPKEGMTIIAQDLLTDAEKSQIGM
jgi:hypothetical protein